ncbi:WD repeat-containing protein 63, partial [Caerostris extrusa]
NVPVYLRERRAYITSGQWSPTRPALFLLGFQDGSIEVWDLLQNHYYPFVKLFMATSPIKFLSIQSMTENQHLVAAGDSKGIVYTMDLLPSLWIPTENELEKVNQMIEKKSPQDTETQSPESIGEPAVPERIPVPEHKPPTQLEEVQLGEEEVMTSSHGEFSTLEKEALTFLDMAEEEIIISEEE